MTGTRRHISQVKSFRAVELAEWQRQAIEQVHSLISSEQAARQRSRQTLLGGDWAGGGEGDEEEGEKDEEEAAGKDEKLSKAQERVLKRQARTSNTSPS